MNRQRKEIKLLNNSKLKNSKLQTDKMEVHHHPKVEKKGFKEYFLEFLMIFLAATMGFFAENLREYFKNKGEINIAASFWHKLKNN